MQQKLDPDALISVYEHAIRQCENDIKIVTGNVRAAILTKNHDAAAGHLRRQIVLINEKKMLNEVYGAETERLSQQQQEE